MTETYVPAHQGKRRRPRLPLAVAAGAVVIAAIVATVFLTTSPKNSFHPAAGMFKTPQAVVAQMESTRALDGMQSATWSTYAVKWTYHPDNGLDLIITHTA